MYMYIHIYIYVHIGFFWKQAHGFQQIEVNIAMNNPSSDPNGFITIAICAGG